MGDAGATPVRELDPIDNTFFITEEFRDGSAGVARAPIPVVLRDVVVVCGFVDNPEDQVDGIDDRGHVIDREIRVRDGCLRRLGVVESVPVRVPDSLRLVFGHPKRCACEALRLGLITP